MNIKTWEDRLQSDYPDMNLSDLTDCDDRRKFAEIADLRAALAKAEQLYQNSSDAHEETMRRAMRAEQECNELQAKLTALEGQEPVAWGNEGWMSSFGVRVGRDTADCIDLIFTKVGGSEYQLYANEAAYLRYLLNKADIPGYTAAGAAPADDTATEWRRLALQFDGHRMQAMSHLKCLLENPQSHAATVAAFLAAPPLCGEVVLADRIKTLAGAAPSPCPHCDDTGDVHRADGEWLGSCNCGAETPAPEPKQALVVQRAPADDTEGGAL